MKGGGVLGRGGGGGVDVVVVVVAVVAVVVVVGKERGREEGKGLWFQHTDN